MSSSRTVQQGVRAGRHPLRLVLVAHPTLVEAFNLMFLPWNLSLMAIAAAEAILDTGEVEQKVEYNNEWMDEFELAPQGQRPRRTTHTATTCC